MDVWFPVVDSIITWILVVLGWLVISDQNELREASKVAHARLQALRESLTTIEALALQHHTEKYDEARVRALLRMLGDFSTEVAYLQKRGHVGVGSLQGVVDLRSAITGKNMDESSFVKQGFQSSILSDVSNARAVIDKELLGHSYNALRHSATLISSVKNVLFHRVF